VIIVAVASSGFREVARKLGGLRHGDQSSSRRPKASSPGRTSACRDPQGETCAKKVGALRAEHSPGTPRRAPRGERGRVALPGRRRAGRHLIHGPRFRVYGNDDIVGVELAGALKNVIAIASGVVTGLGRRQRSLRCSSRAVSPRSSAWGQARSRSSHVLWPRRYRDLFVTCTSPLSRNHRVGAGLAGARSFPRSWRSWEKVAEGVNTTRVGHELSKEHDVAMPITDAVYQLLYEDGACREVLGTHDEAAAVRDRLRLQLRDAPALTVCRSARPQWIGQCFHGGRT